MKTQTNSFYTFIGKANADNYATDVKETIAFGICQPFTKTFTTADMWNIERRKRNRMQRRFL